MFVWVLWMFGSMLKTADQSVCIPLSASLSHHLAESPHQGQCDITRLFYRAYHIMKATLTTWLNTEAPRSLLDSSSKDTQVTFDIWVILKKETHEEEKRQTGRVGSCNVRRVIKSRYSGLCNQMVAKFWFDQRLPEGCSWAGNTNTWLDFLFLLLLSHYVSPPLSPHPPTIREVAWGQLHFKGQKWSRIAKLVQWSICSYADRQSLNHQSGFGISEQFNPENFISANMASQ